MTRPARIPLKAVDPIGVSYADENEESWLKRRIVAEDVKRVGRIPETSTYERRSPTNLPPRRE